MKLILFIVVILFASCTKSIVEAPEVIPSKSVEINRTDVMVSPQFVKGSDNNQLDKTL